MSDSHRITFRIPAKLLSAAQKRREGDWGAYLRRLIAADCGVPDEPLPRGLAGAKKGTAKKVGKLGGRKPKVDE